MQISQAAHAYAGSGAPDFLRQSSHPKTGEAGTSRPGRALQVESALPVFASAVLQRLSNASGTQEPAAVAGAHAAVAAPIAAVARALAAAATRGGDTAADPVAPLLQKVEAALEGAQAQLRRLGYDRDQVAAAAANFRNQVGEALPSEDGEAAPEPAAVQATRVSATQVRKERGQVEILTQDGDVVRIRFRSREADRVDVAAVQGAEGSALSARVASQQSARIQVAVHGDLDAAELAAIEDFLGKVNQLATDFYGGDVEAAFAAGAALQVDAEEIARFAVDLSFSERTRMRSWESGPWSSEPSSALAPAPSQDAAATQPKATQDARDPVPVSGSEQALVPPATVAADGAPASHASAQPAAVPAEEAPVTSSSSTGALESIRSFVQRVLTASQTPVPLHGVEIAWRVKIELSAVLLQAARPQETPSAASELLGTVLDDAAQAATGLQEETVRDAVA